MLRRITGIESRTGQLLYLVLMLVALVLVVVSGIQYHQDPQPSNEERVDVRLR